jgi:hypothetical protein
LHVLGTPPALILSQDQTLKFNFERAIIWLSLLIYYCLVLPLSSFLAPLGFLFASLRATRRR